MPSTNFKKPSSTNSNYLNLKMEKDGEKRFLSGSGGKSGDVRNQIGTADEPKYESTTYGKNNIGCRRCAEEGRETLVLFGNHCR